MKSRLPIGYVVQIDGTEVTLNLLDMHRGQIASHAYGISPVTEVGSLLAIDAGTKVLVMKVLSLSFAEPKEAHRLGVGSSTHQSEPLRNVSGVIVGRLASETQKIKFISDSLSTPPLGAEALPLSDKELASVLGGDIDKDIPITLGADLRSGGDFRVGLETLISRHVAVLGSSGQGKSCFTAAILQQVVQLPQSHVVIFDINGEYEDAFKINEILPPFVKVTNIGGDGNFKIPYYALGRFGLHRLLMPSEKTQRPALSFALEHLHQVKWFPNSNGAGLSNDDRAFLFHDCRSEGAPEAHERIKSLQAGEVQPATQWPHMMAMASLIADSYAIQNNNKGNPERQAFPYGNVSPLITRIQRLVEDPMFKEVVNVEGGNSTEGVLNWRKESKKLIEDIFGNEDSQWRVHIINLRRLPHDLSPFILGSLLELYAQELFRRGQEKKIPTLLVLEEAHHYLRPTGSGEDANENSLAYERLAKEGRKFGLALWLSTQRPSEISPTVLSQCNNWISFRLTSERDLAAIQTASEWSDKREIRRISGLPRRTAVVFGGSIAMPAMIHTSEANPRPRSEDAPFHKWNIADKPSA